MSALFEYALVRFTGDPVRGEAVNVAVLVVDPTTDETELRLNARAQSELQRLWPEFDRAAYQRFVRDLAAAAGTRHQMSLGERAELPSPSRAIDRISTLAANQFSVSDTRRYRGASASQVADALYERFVARRAYRPRRRRHLTRAQLRNLIAAIFTEWAKEQIGVEFRPDDSIAGARAEHPTDLVAYRDGKPDLVFFALPTGGGGRQWSLLVRDSLPTIVADVREITPDVQFFAVLPDESPEAGRGDQDVYRSILTSVEGLRVARVSELREEFDRQARAAV